MNYSNSVIRYVRGVSKGPIITTGRLYRETRKTNNLAIQLVQLVTLSR